MVHHTIAAAMCHGSASFFCEASALFVFVATSSCRHRRPPQTDDCWYDNMSVRAVHRNKKGVGSKSCNETSKEEETINHDGPMPPTLPNPSADHLRYCVVETESCRSCCCCVVNLFLLSCPHPCIHSTRVVTFDKRNRTL